MALEQYLVPVNSRTNICFDCQNYSKCSWGGIDPETEKPAFKPVPGWTAERVLLYSGNHGRKNGIMTYHITACPEFLRDEPRPTAVTNVGGGYW